MATSPLPSRGPTNGRKCYVTPAFSGVPSKGDKIKSGCIEGKDKVWMCRSKDYHKKKFADLVYLRRKTPLETPHRRFFKRGGGSKTPHAIGFLKTPPLWEGGVRFHQGRGRGSSRIDLHGAHNSLFPCQTETGPAGGGLRCAR